MNKNNKINQQVSLDNLSRKDMAKVLEKLHYKRSRINNLRKNKLVHKNKETWIKPDYLYSNNNIYCFSKYQNIRNDNNQIHHLEDMKKIKNLFIRFPKKSNIVNDDKY